MMRAMHARLRTGLLLLLSLGGPQVWAAPPAAASGEIQQREDGHPVEPDPKRAKQLYATGVSELVARDFPAAFKALSESYRLHPTLETLYQLGVLASAQGRRVDAYDITRRFAADKGHGSTAQGTIAYPHQVEVQRMLASTPEDTGELKVIGPAGAFVFVDGRIVGVCPLSLPILLKSGEHVIAAEYGGRKPDATVDVLGGRTGELRFDPSGRAPKVSQRAETSVLITLATPGIPNEQRPLLRSTLTEFATRAGLTAVSADAALINHPDLSSCVGQLPCKLQLATRGSQEHILSARVSLQGSPASGQWRVSVAWINVAVGKVAAQVDLGCTICAQEQAAVLLEESAKRVLAVGVNRASGRLQIKSTPAGAEVLEGEQTLGRTPLDVAMYTGVHQLLLQHPGSRPRRAAVVLESGKTRSLDVELLPMTASTQKGR